MFLKNYIDGYPWLYKTTHFLSFERKFRVKLIYFLVSYSLFWWKTTKNEWKCIILNFSQIKAYSFQVKFKSIFQQRTYNYLSHSIRKKIICLQFIYSQILLNIQCGNITFSSQSTTGLYNLMCV